MSGATSVPDVEDATVLKFGAEFTKEQESRMMTFPEVNLMFEARKAVSEHADPDNPERGLSNLFMKTLMATQRFSRFKNKETIVHLRLYLQSIKTPRPLHPFELAQLVNLCPEKADEAKSLIPSLLGDFTDEDLQDILDRIKSMREFQY